MGQILKIFLSILGVIFQVWVVQFAFAKPLQIIHTNDLHSFFEHGDVPQTGNYASLKFQMDSLKAQAQAQGIDTLVLDAGDFSEGTPFFMAERGYDSWAMMDVLGYDAVVLGNHDWLVGLELMDDILGRLRPRVPFLSANFLFNHWYKNISNHVFPYAEFSRVGLKIAVLGLSTDSALYRWRVRDGVIATPKSTAREWVPKLRRSNDFVIVLTHLGVQDDRRLIRNTSGIDLVVGGHSHTVLQEVLFEKNLARKKIPIVQAGKHGEFVGDLLIDIEKGKPLQILRYQLIPIFSGDSQNSEVAEHIHNSRLHLEHLFGVDNLYKPIAVSAVPLEQPLKHWTWWGQFFVDTLREVSGAEISLDAGEFFGENQPSGEVTPEKLMNFYPRLFDFNLPFGWTVWTLEVPGVFLQDQLEALSKSGLYFILSGIEQNPVTKDWWVNGEKIDQGRHYSVAVSEGVGRGAQDSSRLFKHYLHPKDSGISILYAVEQRLRKMGPVVGPE